MKKDLFIIFCGFSYYSFKYILKLIPILMDIFICSIIIGLIIMIIQGG